MQRAAPAVERFCRSEFPDHYAALAIGPDQERLIVYRRPHAALDGAVRGAFPSLAIDLENARYSERELTAGRSAAAGSIPPPRRTTTSLSERPSGGRGAGGGGRVRTRGSWLTVALLLAASVSAAGCTSGRPRPAAAPTTAAADQAAVWFAQHLVPHLRQDTSIAYLTRDRITSPALARLAGSVHRRGQAHLATLQAWLARRGLAAHGHSHQRGGRREESDLQRLSRLDGVELDLAFARVMAARQRTAGRMAATAAGHGADPELRRLARQLLAEQREILRALSAVRRDRAAGGRPARPSG